jgi:hypothetical protein
MMEEDLGKPVREIYASITASPIAAASLGQVYKATLFSGEEVRRHLESVVGVERREAAHCSQPLGSSG